MRTAKLSREVIPPFLLGIHSSVYLIVLISIQPLSSLLLSQLHSLLPFSNYKNKEITPKHSVLIVQPIVNKHNSKCAQGLSYIKPTKGYLMIKHNKIHFKSPRRVIPKILENHNSHNTPHGIMLPSSNAFL